MCIAIPSQSRGGQVSSPYLSCLAFHRSALLCVRASDYCSIDPHYLAFHRSASVPVMTCRSIGLHTGQWQQCHHDPAHAYLRAHLGITAVLGRCKERRPRSCRDSFSLSSKRLLKSSSTYFQ
jgi:hypothetical protein